MQDVCTGSMPAVVVAVSKTTIEPFPVHGNPLEWLDCRLTRGRMIRIGTVHSRLGNLAMKMQLARNKSILGPGIFGVSPRSIFFGRKGIHRECREGPACELDPKFKLRHCTFSNGSKYLKVQYAILQRIQTQTSQDMRGAEETWDEVLIEYSKMKLTHPDDKLIAISGVASIFESKSNWTSTYGLWVDTIVHSLLWRYDCRSIDDDFSDASAEYMNQPLPSWSWLSMPSGYEVHEFLSDNTTHWAEDAWSATLASWPQNSGSNIPLHDSPKHDHLCIRDHLVPDLEI
jgi:hypothetical protein